VRLQVRELEARLPPAILSVGASADNTLYESAAGNISNGIGQNFYVGTSNQTAPLNLRRGLIKFDVSVIPAGSTLTSVTLALHVSKPNNGTQTIDVHRATSEWGEGTSDAATGGDGSGEGSGTTATTGDATWLHTFFNTQTWTTPGGDFVAAPSASNTVGAASTYQWTGPGLLADVQQWFDTPASNFGWVITGNETTSHSSKQFDTRENNIVANRPRLTIDYTAPPPDLTIDKSHVGDFTQGDDGKTYTILVGNTGVGPTSGMVTITDILPAGLLPTAADNGVINGWNTSFVGQTITATRTDVLAPGNSYPALTITVDVEDTAPASVVNTATVAVGDEVNTANNSDDDPTDIDPGVPNQSPINTLPATYSGTEDTTIVLSGISVDDPDSGSANVAVTFTVNGGSLAFATNVSGGVTAGQVSGNGSNSVVVTASTAAINATLGDAAGLQFTPALNSISDAALTIVTNDLGHFGLGGPQSDSDPSTISLAAVNDAPGNTLPSASSADSDTPVVLSGISIADVDAGSSLVSLILNVTNGRLTMSTSVAGGVSAGETNGNGSGLISIVSTVAKINATLADANGLVFSPAGGFSGLATLTVVTNDLGSSGSGGPIVHVSNQAITVSPVARAATQLVFEQEPVDTLANAPFLLPIRIVSKDEFGNPAKSNETVTIRLQSASSGVKLLGTTSIQLVDGAASFSDLRLSSAGTALRLVASTPSLTAAVSDFFDVVAVARFDVTTVATTATAGTQVSVTVRALDSKGQVVTNYPGVVRFASSDNQAILPANATLTNGEGMFNVTLKTAGPQTIRAVDVTKSTLLGFARKPVKVTPVGVDALAIIGVPSAVSANQKQKVTVAAVDAFGNVNAGYRGTVTLSSGDVAAVLPPAYTFTARDAGRHVFSATLKTTGLQSLTAGDGTLTTTKIIAVAGVELTVVSQPDPQDAGKMATVVLGTPRADLIRISSGVPDGTQFDLSFNGISQGVFPTPNGRLFIYGLGGNDHLTLVTGLFSSPIATSAMLDGGAGNDILIAGMVGGDAILVGGDGNDSLLGGAFRDIMIGGRGKDTMRGGGGEDILVGDATKLDGDLSALLAVMTEWNDPGADFLDRVRHLNNTTAGGANGLHYLNATTIMKDTSVDQLFGNGHTDWFNFTTAGKFADLVLDATSGEFLTGL
jgi:hypothetical protein